MRYRDIDGFKGKYKISDLGDVYSAFKNAVMKPEINLQGYEVIALHIGGGKYKRHRVHRLVAAHFIPNHATKAQVNHLDGNKRNNIYSNLEWASPSENTQHSYNNGLQPKGSKHHKSKLTEEQAEWIKQNYKPHDPDYGAKPMALMLGVTSSLVSYIGRGIVRVS